MRYCQRCANDTWWNRKSCVKCSSITANCTKCDNPKAKCMSCAATYVLTVNSTCACPPGMVDNNGKGSAGSPGGADGKGGAGGAGGVYGCAYNTTCKTTQYRDVDGTCKNICNATQYRDVNGTCRNCS